MSKDVLAAIGGRRTRMIGLVVAAVVAAAFVPWVSAETAQPHGWGHSDDRGEDKLLFFASDGLMQQSVEKYSDQGVTPGFRELLKHGARASDHGLMTEAPPNTGSGWFTLATGAWPGVHGSTNNTFHKNGDPFAQTSTHPGRTTAFDPGVLQAETLAQAAERGGKKVAQIEWAGGRSAEIDGPTIDFRGFFSGRGVVTNYIAPADSAQFVQSFGLQFDHPTGFAGQPGFPAAAPSAATGWTSVPRSYSPAKETRMRVIDFGTDKYGLNAYIYDSKNDKKTRYDRVLFSPTKSGSNKVGDLREGEWADVKVTLQTTNALNGKTGAMLVKVERLASDLSQVRLFHTSVTRANASWPTWPGEPGFTGSFEDFVAERFPSSQAGDFAVLEAGIVSEETYVEQGLYWETGHHPLIRYVLDRYKPDLAMVGYPVTDEFQHQFLGLVTKRLPNGDRNPSYDDVAVDGSKDGRVKQREAFIKRSYQGSDATMRLAQDRLKDKDLTTFLSSDHGFAPQFLAIDASKVLVDLKLLSHPQTSNCRPVAAETISSAKACFAGGTLQVYLNVAGRDPAPPAGSTIKQIPATEVANTVNQIKAAFLALEDPNDWDGDGQPEGWDVIDRVFTKAEARYIPNGDDSFADMSHPTRTGDLVVFSNPPYQYDAATPGTLFARSAFFGQHGYVPDTQDLDSNTNMRATFLAGGKAIDRGVVHDVRSIDLAPTAAFLLDVPVPERSQGVVRRDLLDDGDKYRPLSIVGLNDFHGQLEPTTLPGDNALPVSLGGAGQLATMFDEEADALPGRTLLLAAGDNVGASPPNSALLDDMPAIDVENAWGLDATSLGNHEFDFGVERLLAHIARADFPFLATNVVEEDTGREPDWLKTSKVFWVRGMPVGVIGSVVRTTPELVRADATEGLVFLDEAERLERESARLRRMGVKIQVVVIHEGAADGANRQANRPAVPWTGPITTIVGELQNTTIDLVIAGHTHRAANTVVGKIPVVEGFNAGASYTVAQLMIRGDDVAWTGAATRSAKNLGVTSRADVQAIVDAANAETAVLRNEVIGTQTGNILRDGPERNDESAMGNFVTDAMRLKYPGVEAAITNSGGLRADLFFDPPPPPTVGGGPGEITWGEVFAVLPFGNRTTILTLTGAQLQQAFVNGFSAVCNSAINTGRYPQISGLVVGYHCAGTQSVIDGIWKAPNGPSGTRTPVGPTDTVRFVTNDFMFTGGDGYTVFSQGTNVLQPGDALLDVVVDHIKANSPVSAAIEGRIIEN